MSTSKDMDFSKMLTSFDIELCRENLDDLVIAPFDKTQAKGIGYNIAASDLFYSLKKSMPLKICHDDSGSYAIIKPNDTVLVLSYEYLKTNNCVAGTFHSKVRGAASGLGNVSTTLDPNWKGMLLISINNPTSRKIKVPITIKKDGKTERCSLLTLVPFRNPCPLEKDGETWSFHLDNPPMRADIWSDLIDKPNRWFHNKKYKKFQSFIQKMINFSPKENDVTNTLKEILNKVTQLEVALKAEYSLPDVKKSLFELQQMILKDYPYLKMKFDKMNKEINDKENGIDIESCLKKAKSGDETSAIAINELVDPLLKSLRDDCEYLILCDEVEQIHKFVSYNVETWWKYGRIKTVINDYVFANLAAIIASVLIVLALILGNNFFASDSLAIKIIVAIIPTLLSFIINHFRRKDD